MLVREPNDENPIRHDIDPSWLDESELLDQAFSSLLSGASNAKTSRKQISGEKMNA